jgi:hypothetical protein
MFKSIALIATVCIGLVSASVRDVDTKINNRFALAMAKQEAIREKHGLGKYARPKLAQDTEATDTKTDFWDCARGFAKGLQFSPNSQGACYISLDESINMADDFSSLLRRAYNPTVWADISSSASNSINYVAAIQSNCEILKLLNSVTTSATTLIPQLIGRLAGGMVAELPTYYYRLKKANTCYAFFYQSAKIFSLITNYYI